MTHPHPDIAALLKIYDELKVVHTKLYMHMIGLSEGLQAGKYDTVTLVDYGVTCREIAKRCDDARKDANNRVEVIGQKIAFDVMTRKLAGEEVEDPVKGLFASGTPNMKKIAARPKVGSPENEALLKYLGIDPQNAEHFGKILKADWDQLSLYVTQLAERGKPLPPGITHSYPVYFTNFRLKADSGF